MSETGAVSTAPFLFCAGPQPTWRLLVSKKCRSFVANKTYAMTASANIFLPLKFTQIFELVKQLPNKEKQQLLGLLRKDQEKNMPIPEEHKKIVRQRVKKYAKNPDALIDWDKAQKMIILG